MSNRKEFEAWYLDVWGYTEDSLNSLFDESPHGNEYYRFGVRLAWQAWQQATKQAEAKYAAQDEKLHMINELTGAVEQVNKLAQEATERLIQERNALAAENAALKGIIEQYADSFAVCPNCSHEEPSETDDIVALYRSMETPATGAFLAEVRASGVEMFALMFAEEAIKSNNITTGWRAKASRAASEYAEALREDAAQLRQGAAL